MNLTFLAPPGEVADWRYVVLCDAAARSGALAALPGSASEVAERAGLDADAVRIQLDALSVFDVVRKIPGGRYELGPSAPTDDEAAVLAHHARVISSWATRVPPALEGTLIPGGGPPPDRARWLQALSCPAGPYDLAFCAGITHTFGGDRVLALFQQAARVLSPGGSIAISTFLSNRRPVSSLFAVQMMLVGSGAATHPEEHYRGWLASAGFGPVQIDDPPGLDTSLITAALRDT